jgi:predicted CoA-binding protein
VKPDVADSVVPPKIKEQVVKTCKSLGIKKVWMQPGSESETAISFCRENEIDVVHGVCVMFERRSRQK